MVKSLDNVLELNSMLLFRPIEYVTVQKLMDQSQKLRFQIILEEIFLKWTNEEF